jgi:hypothetical protein
MSGLEVIREMREVDCHFRRFGRFSKQIFAGMIVGRPCQTPGVGRFEERRFTETPYKVDGPQGRGCSLRAMHTRR